MKIRNNILSNHNSMVHRLFTYPLTKEEGFDKKTHRDIVRKNGESNEAKAETNEEK